MNWDIDMARRIYYKIPDNNKNNISDEVWDEIIKLQHWYNTEFIWTAGKINLKMYVVFPNFDERCDDDEETLWQLIIERRSILRKMGLSENEIIRQLKSENLIIIKKGGYFDNCVASGFTRVAANEWNAYLVCEFLLKVSRIITHCDIHVKDEGKFIKCQDIIIQNGNVTALATGEYPMSFYKGIIQNRRIFSIVDSAKYNNFPVYHSIIQNFNTLRYDEQKTYVHDWKWLGFEDNYDSNGDDIQGYDLNRKVIEFRLEIG